MWLLSLTPFLLQTIAIAFDEGYFHVKRGLPKWERIGHPIDTFSVVCCLAFVLWVPFSQQSLWGYITLSALSCFLVTKDEFVHKEHCQGAEQWLHAILFTLHPLTLIALGIFWALSNGVAMPTLLTELFSLPFTTRTFFKCQLGSMGLFLFYQIFFWNFLWKDKPVIKKGQL